MMIWSISVVNSGSHDCKILLDYQGGRVGKYSVCGTPSWRSKIHAARSKTELEWGARCKYDKCDAKNFSYFINEKSILASSRN